jgi:hypothetical protein
MPSVKESETKQATDPVTAAPAKIPDKLGEEWDSLRGLTNLVQRQRRSANVLTAIFALLLILTFAFVGWVLHDHLPALVDFGKQVSEEVSTFVANQPKPSTATHDANDLSARSAHKKHRSFPARVAYPDRADDSDDSDEAYDPLSHPFTATAIVDGRRVPLVPNNRIVVVDVANGTWTMGLEPE